MIANTEAEFKYLIQLKHHWSGALSTILSSGVAADRLSNRYQI